MKYLSRKKIYQRVEVAKDAKKVYVFCEGEKTELQYFMYFQGFSSNIDLIPIPSVDGKSDPVKLKEHADFLFFGNDANPPRYLLSQEYKDEIWFVIDTDNWNEGDKINQLKEYCSLKNTSIGQWSIAQSNPCFELWFYYHFNSIKPEASEVEKHASFKQYVNHAVKGGFDCRWMPIEIEAAIFNSKGTLEILEGQPGLYSTEVHILGDIIVSFVKDQLDKAKKMIHPDNIQ